MGILHPVLRAVIQEVSLSKCWSGRQIQRKLEGKLWTLEKPFVL